MTGKKETSPTSNKNNITSKIMSNLNSDEITSCVAYASENSIAAGTVLKFPRISIDVPCNAFIAFVDRDPMANWSHSCRYILLSYDTSEVRSFEAQFPPFQSERQIHWRLVYKAPSVPDAAVASDVID
jgi:hypothetical protein